MRIDPVVKYDWEQRRYVGNLIAVHLNRTHVAYVLRGMNNSVHTADFSSVSAVFLHSGGPGDVAK